MMYYFIKTVTIVITGFILLGLTGCMGKTSNIVTARSKAVSTSAETDNKMEYDNKINVNNLNFTLPANWVKRGNDNEIFFDAGKKQTVGGISLVGYYGDPGTSLPNHSKILNTEYIHTSLGKGSLFTLQRSNPAASDNPKTWNEVHVIIPTNKNNLAYDIWVNVKKDILINILQSLH